jgi:hypothetical protein
MTPRFIAEWAVLIALAIAAYFYYVRPVLKRIPPLQVLFKTEDSAWAAVRERFAGIKTFLAIGVGQAITAVLFLYDDVLPYATGVDFTPLTSKVPGWVWPIVILFWLWLIGKFRKYTDERRAAMGKAQA